jgi:hypothetical protein
MKKSLKTPLASVMAVAVMTVAAGHAGAQAPDPSAPKTREQVRAELMEAQRTGDILANDDSGMKLNELYPSRYPAHPGAQGVTRAEVKSELFDAQRRGDVIVQGDAGKKLNELYPKPHMRKSRMQ